MKNIVLDELRPQAVLSKAGENFLQLFFVREKVSLQKTEIFVSRAHAISHKSQVDDIPLNTANYPNSERIRLK